VSERGVDAWELNEAKAFTLGRMLLGGPREDASEEALASALAESETTGDEQLDLRAFSAAYLDVTLDHANAAAKKYYRPTMLKVVAIGAIPTGPKQMVFPPGTFKALF
jgi:predicted Zn-dependent peptidase